MVDPLHLRTVLKKYYSNKSWRFDELAISYDEFEWFDTDPKPSPEHINFLYQEIVDNAWREEHVAIREAEYPSKEDLIVALWEKLVEQDGLTSDKIHELQAKRLAIKRKYPKLNQRRQTPPNQYTNPAEPDKFA